MSVMRTALTMTVLTLMLCITGSASRAEVRLELDSLSFFFVEGARQGGALPASASLALEVSRISDRQWAVHADPAGFELADVVYPSGYKMSWRIEGRPTGIATRRADGVELSMTVPVVGRVHGRATEVRFTLEFTTETADVAARGHRAYRRGARLDPRSGYVQLVAAGINKAHAATGPEMPFYVVLSGKISGLPASMRQES